MYCWEVRCDSTAVACGLNTSFCQGFLCSHRTPLSRIAIHLAQVHAAKLWSLLWMKVSSTLLWHIQPHLKLAVYNIRYLFNSMHMAYVLLFLLMFHGLPMVQGLQVSVSIKFLCSTRSSSSIKSALGFWRPPPATLPVSGWQERGKRLAVA